MTLFFGWMTEKSECFWLLIFLWKFFKFHWSWSGPDCFSRLFGEIFLYRRGDGREVWEWPRLPRWVVGIVWILILELCTCEKKQKTTKKVARKPQRRMPIMLRKKLECAPGWCIAGVCSHWRCCPAVWASVVKISNFPDLVPRETIWSAGLMN